MRPSDVTFRNAVVEIENVHTGQKQREMEIIEIRFPDGKVSAFPVTDVNAESGRRYCDLFARKYAAFKNGDPDPDRVEQLEREIEERKAELKALRTKPKDDKRVQENLGYGKLPDPAAQKAGEATRDRNETTTARGIGTEPGVLGEPAFKPMPPPERPADKPAFVPPTDADRANHEREGV